MKKIILAAVFTLIATLTQANPNLTSTKDSTKYDIQQVSTSRVSVNSSSANNGHGGVQDADAQGGGVSVHQYCIIYCNQNCQGLGSSCFAKCMQDCESKHFTCKPRCTKGTVCCGGGDQMPSCSDLNEFDNCGQCGQSCNQGQACCDHGCTDLGTLQNCTGCGDLCTGVLPGCCTHGCVDLDSDPLNCRQCGISCPSGPANSTPKCTKQQCGWECNPGFTRCFDTECDNLSNDVKHCGGCSTMCKPPTNATATCISGKCDFLCTAGFTKCGTGCCPPPPKNAISTCTNSECGFSCNAGFTKCGNTCCPPPPANGTSACINETCGFTCKAGFTKCGNSCCPPPPPNATFACVNGTCGFSCNTGFTKCGSVCCQPGLGCCNGVCKNTASDPLNCGPGCQVCPQSCSNTRSCTSGKCATLSAYGFLVEIASTGCAYGTQIEQAFDAGEAQACVDKLYPPPNYVVGPAPAGFVTCAVYCEGYACSEFSVQALSDNDALRCLQSNYPNCTVEIGTCQ